MKYINHDARHKRHQKIWIYWNKIKLNTKKSYFILKILLTALVLSFVDFWNNYLLLNNIEEDLFVAKQTDINNTFILEEDWFVLKKEVQTEKRNKENQHEIIKYTIKKWDSLHSIASEYEIKIITIIDANPWISSKTKLIEWKNLRILPVDWIDITLTSDTNIRDLANNYKIAKNIILKQNGLWTWTFLLSKWVNLIIPWVTKIKPINNTKYNSNSKYKWIISRTIIKPCNWLITQWFKRWHYALDIANRNKWPIFAAANWVVSSVKYWWNWWYWNMIIIDHWNWMQTLYWHNEKQFVKKWEVVKQGQTIAWMWNTWRVRWKTWIHLHFEIIINWKKRNPLAYF